MMLNLEVQQKSGGRNPEHYRTAATEMGLLWGPGTWTYLQGQQPHFLARTGQTWANRARKPLAKSRAWNQSLVVFPFGGMFTG